MTRGPGFAGGGYANGHGAGGRRHSTGGSGGGSGSANGDGGSAKKRGRGGWKKDYTVIASMESKAGGGRGRLLLGGMGTAIRGEFLVGLPLLLLLLLLLL